MEQEERKERESVAQSNDAVLPPQEIAQDPKNKELGKSSDALRIQDFDLVKTLGTGTPLAILSLGTKANEQSPPGTFARVWLARLSNPRSEQERKATYALKILRKVDIIRLKQVEHVRNERSTLGAVAGHPFITKLIRTFADRDSLYMLLDYCPGGEVFTYLRRARRFPESTARFYAAEIVLVLEFLHEEKGIAYRDLKPENILLDAEGHLKLVDFGFAKPLGKRETYTLCGTPEYLAPEVIRNTGHGMAVDWWAFGILLYEFLIGQPPFLDQNPMKIYSKIVQGHVVFPDPPRARNPQAPHQELQQHHHRKEQELFPSQAARDLILAVCTVNPSERLGNIAGGTARVKEHDFFNGIDWDALYWRQVKGPIIPQWSGGLDSRCFDSYDDPPESRSVYTRSMMEDYDDAFVEF